MGSAEGGKQPCETRRGFRRGQFRGFDDAALVIPDPDHSLDEERFVIMGQSNKPRMLVVVHCFRSRGSVIRIISARRAGTKEQQPYWEKRS